MLVGLLWLSLSVSSLRKIAVALGTKVGSFFEDEEKKDFMFIRKDGRKKFLSEGSKTHCLDRIPITAVQKQVAIKS